MNVVRGVSEVVVNEAGLGSPGAEDDGEGDAGEERGFGVLKVGDAWLEDEGGEEDDSAPGTDEADAEEPGGVGLLQIGLLQISV